MDSKKPSRIDLSSSCDNIGPEDGIDPRTEPRDFSRKPVQRKALQLCRQVARTLSDVIAWECGDEVLSEAIVESVQPAPNSGRLLVTIVMPSPRANVTVDDVQQRLQRAQGSLRREVAAAIHRRRVPELTFRVVISKEE
jgi:ribosome-binding factor A